MSELFNIDLPKWPACVVEGTSVTEEQAAEILIRTDDWAIFTNDREWQGRVFRLAGMAPRPSWDCRYADDAARMAAAWKEHDDLQALFREQCHVLQLGYLWNRRIASCWAGGPYGWCSWDGTIGLRNKNIGKWPTVEEVHDDWAQIAQEFPFLDLRCQLFDQEHCDDSPAPLIEYVVKEGAVRMRTPEIAMETSTPGFDWSSDTERGCSAETLKWAIGLVEEKYA